MIVRLSKFTRLDRAAIALLSVAALDPAVGQTEPARYADVMILTLCDMQDVILTVAFAFHEGENLLKKHRIRFLGAGVVCGEA